MELLYIGCTHFLKKGNEWFSFPSSGDEFFQNFLGVFDSIRVLGTGMPSYVDYSTLSKITDKRIEPVDIANTNLPIDIKRKALMCASLEEEIKKAEAILIKPANYRGIQAIKIAKKHKKPYMIYLTGDIYSQLKNSNSILKKIYAPYIYYSTKRAIKDCKFGLYISENFLQKMYPIKGKSYSCPDVVVPDVEDYVLENRLQRIKQRTDKSIVNIALIGFYHGNAKGVDTAIEALSRLDDRFHLNILGFGTKENQDKWIQYGDKIGVQNRIHFPEPKNGSVEVMKWLDTQDLFTLPSRSEGFGRVIIEAMARGCPCVCTNVCTIPEIVKEEWLINVGDAERLSLLIKKIFGDKNLECSIAQENIEFAKTFTFQKLQARRNACLNDFKIFCKGKGNT